MTERKLSTRDYVHAVIQVATETYKAAPWQSLVQLGGAFVTAILPIVTTYFAALTTTALADAYIGKPGAGEQAIIYVLITSALGIILAAWRSLERYVSEMMRYQVEASISDRMYNHLLHLDFWRYDDKDTADLYDRARDFANFFPYVFSRVSGLVGGVISVVVNVLALAFVSWWLSLVILIAIIPSVYIQFKLSRQQVAHRNAHVMTRRAKSLVEWLLGNQRETAELRLYGVIKHLLTLRQKLRNKDEKERIEFERRYILKQLAADVLLIGAEIIALVYIVIQIIMHRQPIGQFIYVQQVVGRVVGSVTGFVSDISSLDEDLANLFDYQEFMRLPESQGGTHKLRSAPSLIELKNVTFHYQNSETVVLDNVSLAIEKGTHIAIVGENGAGKSTLIKMLTGLYNPLKGEVLLDGKDLREIDVSSWHRMLGVLQQSSAYYTFVNAKDNVLFGDVSRPQDEGRYEKAMRLAEAKTFVDKLPKGDQTYIDTWMEDEEGNKGVDISGGQWQRLALARNFYRDSPIIILDEPTSAIDALAESRIFKHLFADKSKTVVTISHRLTTVEKADVIYMLQEGKIIEQGTHAELVARKGAYYRMFESQIRP